MLVPKIIWDYTTVNDNQAFQPDSADVVFLNIGDRDVRINNLILQPGDSMADNCFGNEYNNSNYQINFDETAGTSNILVIKRKRYVGFQEIK
jgi:hypothetical protein